MQEWEVKLDQLTNSGVIGAYHYCKVDQIVLFDKKIAKGIDMLYADLYRLLA